MLKQYLGQLVVMYRACGNSIHGYSSLEEFVLRHGREFAWEKRGRIVKDVEPNQCFMNAAKLALDTGLTYVEGFAVAAPAPIAVQHAWCVLDGLVIDPTWDAEALLVGARSYFGIPIRTEYLRETLLRREIWGVMDDWQGGYPMLSVPPSEWLDERVKSGPGVKLARGGRKNGKAAVA